MNGAEWVYDSCMPRGIDFLTVQSYEFSTLDHTSEVPSIRFSLTPTTPVYLPAKHSSARHPSKQENKQKEILTLPTTPQRTGHRLRSRLQHTLGPLFLLFLLQLPFPVPIPSPLPLPLPLLLIINPHIHPRRRRKLARFLVTRDIRHFPRRCLCIACAVSQSVSPASASQPACRQRLN